MAPPPPHPFVFRRSCGDHVNFGPQAEPPADGGDVLDRWDLTAEEAAVACCHSAVIARVYRAALLGGDETLGEVAAGTRELVVLSILLVEAQRRGRSRRQA